MGFRLKKGLRFGFVRVALLSIYCMLHSANAFAQRYPFFNIGIEQGLVQSQVFAMAQDSAGHLWAGTLGGLSCYDGRQFRSYTMRDGLPSNMITALCCDKKGDICIGTDRGLSIYDGHRFRNYGFTSTDNPRGNAVTRLTLSPDNTLWCLAGGELYTLQKGRITRVPGPQGIGKPTALTAIGADIWLGSQFSGSLYRFHQGRWDSLALPERAPMFVHRIYKDAQQRLMLIAKAGLFRHEAGSWTPIYARKDPKEPLIYAFREGADGSYWLGTGSGAIRISSVGVQRFDRRNGFTDLVVQDVLCDREGNVWLGTNGEGLYRFSGAAFTAVDERMGLEGPQVSSIAQDGQGITYFGTYDGGLYRYKAGRAARIPFPNGIKVPVASLELQDDVLWIGTQSYGLLTYNIQTGSFSQVKDERIGPSIMMLVQDTAGIWVGHTKGLSLIRHDSTRHIPVKNGLEAFAIIGRDSILLATGDGLMLHARDTTQAFKTGSAIDSAQIVCMMARKGIVWIGTSDNGLFGYQLRNGNLIHVGRKEGLRSDFIYNVYATPEDAVWVGTGYGICRIIPRQPYPSVSFYGRDAGLVGMESNKNAVLPLPDGSIWFGTTGGALLYNPKNALAVTKPASLQLQNVAVFGEAVKDTAWYEGKSAVYGVPQGLRLPYQKNNLSFSFAAVSLSGDEDVSYRYRLEGLPAPWSEWSTNNTVTFSALPPGTYELLVQCSADGLNPQPEMLRYPFEIITPFHKTGLFRFLIIAACIILGVLLQYLAARGKRKRIAQLAAVRREEQARVRQRTAEDFHDEVGNKLTRINVLTNVLRNKVGANPDVSRIIDQIQDNAGQLYGGTRDILWSLHPSNDNLYQVMHRIRDFGRDLFGDTDTNFEMEDIPQSWKEYALPMDASRNLIMIFKEALNNTLKYAGATKVEIAPAIQAGEMIIVLHDNGEGFDYNTAKRGQGINNMNTRAGRLGGSIDIATGSNEGTTITLRFKIPQNKGFGATAISRNL